MKKFIYLLTCSLVFVNFSCASLFENGSGICNCTCEVCKDCKNKHKRVLTPEEIAKLENGKSLSGAEDVKRQAELDSILNMDYSIVHYEIPEIKPYAWKDNEVITTPKDSLLALFNTRKSTTGGDTEYLHKGINSNVKENDCYFYFNTTNGVPEPLRFVVHYYADDAVNFEDLIFNIGKFQYKYTPTNIKRSNDGKFYTENFDNALDVNSRDIAAGLAQCKYANIVLHSKGVSHRLFLTEKQLNHFRETYKLYRLMGGKL